MDWIIEHWRILAGIAAFIVVLLFFVWGVSSAWPETQTIKDWSISQAIFYGFCVLAVATIYS